MWFCFVVQIHRVFTSPKGEMSRFFFFIVLTASLPAFTGIERGWCGKFDTVGELKVLRFSPFWLMASWHSKLPRKQQLAESEVFGAQPQKKAGKLDQMKRIKDKVRELHTQQWAGAQIRSRTYLLDNREALAISFFYSKVLNEAKRNIIHEVIEKDSS